jgi:acyl carrier protein phosphodiesterase
LRPVHGKYAPVILDVFFDYILVENWQHFSAEPLGEFAGFAYATLEKHVHLMPVFLQERLPLMIADDWLVRYGTKDGLAFTFSRMKLRSSFPEFFENALDSLQSDYSAYQREFLAFFPDAIHFVKDLTVSD